MEPKLRHGSNNKKHESEYHTMSSMNHVILLGNLTRDPESRTLATGQTVAELGLAVNETYRDKEGKSVDKTCFVDITVWGKQAESCQKFLKKGAQVLVEGKLQFDQWTTDGGEKRSRLRVTAHRVQFVGKPAEGAKGKPKPEPEEEFEPTPF
jgi:single-strand DNA-binding protein